ncbi:4-hydroxy-3-methylbut-2-enyl diphosphate reductase [Gammaproteobacteria bacterium]|jgi:4-hydroxy-3-methylbut-2-enyl diphosphate reductase|nr:4-hydroxy-3-methylbut-2-enyl diphosphate reductase [Gammaproteobacteria bacterium]MDB2447928.1 4-hydroxy-3-methylbut-2-enyl diphosphate reductase [Gammaproteobacteria bacterium]MDB2503101.1 4-hydroxy-3-methylbut-2-enyl diphosphate reductase [Gammaproteobacteria bacterium]MDB2704885.1 4-hydroxy-3-methylbut-2-enyl diphosphate reductase [Gammaproteobacteria bacterium]MDC0348060.1 4-hydroxy-3-methylbut-2-enyl diphosphate reductase [Gammaproteobacteria bacterium]
MSVRVKEIKLANPRGFCAGVDRAIDIVNRALEIYGSPVYVKHEVVHNKFVVEDLKKRGAIFVEEIDEIPDGSLVVFSAHGVSNRVEEDTKSRNLQYFDATCPLVTKVHMEVIRHARSEKDIILIGHEGHPEVEGTMGRHINTDFSNIYLVQDDKEAAEIEVSKPQKLALVTQTTLSVDDTKSIINILKSRFPNIKVPKNDDICYATQNRQDAVKQLALESDYMIVVGSVNSSNSNRLKELAEKCGCKAVLIDEFDELNLAELDGCKTISITAGASAPEERVQEIAHALKEYTGADINENGEDKESIFFKLPPLLR